MNVNAFCCFALIILCNGFQDDQFMYRYADKYFRSGFRKPKMAESTTAQIVTTIGSRPSVSLDDLAKVTIASGERNLKTSAPPTIFTKIQSTNSHLDSGERSTYISTTLRSRLAPETKLSSTSAAAAVVANTTPRYGQKITTQKTALQTDKTTAHVVTSRVPETTPKMRMTPETTLAPMPNKNFYHGDLKQQDYETHKVKVTANQNLVPLPAGAGAALVKPTKYHYYPHNQHIYLLPECAIQQVCNAVYVRLNYTQPLCACPSRYRDPCSASLNTDDLHTTELITDPKEMRALTLVKTCEPTSEMRICRAPRDWSLLALQNIRTGKSHYLVICRCPPTTNLLEGPISHDQPTYASVPGIRVYGMMCVQNTLRRRNRILRLRRSYERPAFPWHKVIELNSAINWD